MSAGAAALLVLAGAAYYFFFSQKIPAPETLYNSNLAGAYVPFTPIASGSRSSVSTRVNYVITTSDQLAQLWKMIDVATPPPTVDFTKNVVLAVFAGKQPTTGFEISVDKIQDSTSTREVVINIAKPGGSCVLAQSETAPYQIVQTSITSLSLTHQDQVTTVSCLQ